MTIVAPTLDAQRSAVERVMKRTTLNPETGCLEFQGCREGGYGRIGVGGRMVFTHRLALAEATRRLLQDVPTTEYALHSCDNPLCCNPEHLRWGTQRENVKDCHDRGRASNGRPERTHCPLGHRLIGANLVPWFWERGVRTCRVCHRARSAVSSESRAGRACLLEDAVADQLRRTDKGRYLVARDALS